MPVNYPKSKLVQAIKKNKLDYFHDI